MRGIAVEAGYVSEFLTARLLEAFADLVVDLFQRLDAVGRKGRGHHRDPLLAVLRRQPRDLVHGIGLEPLLGTKDRLEGRGDLGILPAEALLEEPRRLLALA